MAEKQYWQNNKTKWVGKWTTWIPSQRTHWNTSISFDLYDKEANEITIRLYQEAIYYIPNHKWHEVPQKERERKRERKNHPSASVSLTAVSFKFVACVCACVRARVQCMHVDKCWTNKCRVTHQCVFHTMVISACRMTACMDNRVRVGVWLCECVSVWVHSCHSVV